MSLEKIAKDALKNFGDGTKAAVKELAKESQALAASAETTGQITVRAAQDVARGDLDIEGAWFVTQNGFKQLEQLAVAEGNLVASSFVQWLKQMAKTLLDLAPWLPKIPT